MTDNAIIQSIVDVLGINKTHVAKLIGVDKSVLSKMANAIRLLPIKATYPLVQIHAITHLLPTPQHPQPTESDKQVLLLQLLNCQIQLRQLQKQLHNMQQLFNQGNALLQFIQAYKPTHSSAPAKQQRLLEELNFQANKKIVANGWLPQQQLQVKITLLLTEIELLKAQT